MGSWAKYGDLNNERKVIYENLTAQSAIKSIQIKDRLEYFQIHVTTQDDIGYHRLKNHLLRQGFFRSLEENNQTISTRTIKLKIIFDELTTSNAVINAINIFEPSVSEIKQEINHCMQMAWSDNNTSQTSNIESPTLNECDNINQTFNNNALINNNHNDINQIINNNTIINNNNNNTMNHSAYTLHIHNVQPLFNIHLITPVALPPESVSMILNHVASLLSLNTRLLADSFFSPHIATPFSINHQNLLLNILNQSFSSSETVTLPTPPSSGINEEKINELIKIAPLSREIPEEFKCQISDQLMTDPVSDPTTSLNKVYYDKPQILHWLECESLRNNQPSSPFTKIPLSPERLTVDIELKEKINHFIQEEENKRNTPQQVNENMPQNDIMPPQPRPIVHRYRRIRQSEVDLLLEEATEFKRTFARLRK